MRFLITLVVLLITTSGVEAGPIAVRQPEGAVYGVLALRTTGGEVLAHGELIQTVRGHHVDSQLVFRFNDGSVFDERVVFSQQKLFGLTSYRLTQRGPAFPGSSEVTFVRGSGQYRAKIREKPDANEEVLEGRLDMPSDVYNGMSSVLLKNLGAEQTATGRLLAFTPKPRLLAMKLSSEGTDDFQVGAATRKATRWLVNLELGGMLGVLASIAGKDPPDLRYWIAAAPLPPAFVKFEGPFYLNGPVWRIELAGPRWPEGSKRQ
ncbi:MAG TPA: hypothetical protein VFU40_13040 [Gemmatimonadales bacterium]|nr:hypothetical protein [Gemmatimonadales bacterium]